MYYVELVTSQEIRIQRNSTENRLKHNASPNDLVGSHQRLIDDETQYRCVSNEGEIPFENYLKIDNSNLSAQTVAQEIKQRFNLYKMP